MALSSTYRAWQVEKAGAPLVLKEFELEKPSNGQILVKVLACGVCHSDAAMQQGNFGNDFPRIPGHEVVGDVVAVGDDVARFSGGERVGGPWHGGHDHTCRSCQRGQYLCCEKKDVNGVSRDGGYAEFVLLRAEAVVRVPSDVDPVQVAPLLCAGVTVFNAIRKMHVEQGNLVAVQGLGGLGHLAVQFARKMGYKVAALSSGPSKRDFATELGAHVYIDTSAVDPVKQLQEMGGAALIVCTAPNAQAISPLTGALQPGGKLLVLAPVGNVEINTVDLIMGGCSVHGWPAGNALDVEEAIAFAGTHGVKCLVEEFAFDKAPEAVAHMMANKVRFRSVLSMQ